MRFKQLRFFIAIALGSFLLASCGSSTSDKVNNSDDFKEAEKETLSEQIEEVVYNIPSPTEIPYLLQATGADYNPSLINSRSKVDQYASHNDKAALNLGVYAADVGYLASYDKTQEAISQLSACKTLAENLNIIGAFDAAVLQKFEDNISNKDSLSILLDNSIKKTENFLKDDNRNKLSALVIAGSFVEGLYISTGLIKTYPKDILPDDKRNLILTPLMRVILEQKKSVSELLKMLNNVEQTDPITGMIADLKSLESAYAALNIEEQIKNNRADLVLTDKNLTQITNVVEKMRGNITE
ncbi:MAG TPA: hypothetical protein VD884_13585 [Ohtaekwangia sp.]|nr:hypothetical protein [Ohtaekwangia sp.]